MDAPSTPNVGELSVFWVDSGLNWVEPYPDWADADNSIPDSADSITDAPAFINGFCGWACAP